MSRLEIRPVFGVIDLGSMEIDWLRSRIRAVNAVCTRFERDGRPPEPGSYMADVCEAMGRD